MAVGGINGVGVGTGRVGAGIGVLNGVGIVVDVAIRESVTLLQAAKRGPNTPAASPSAAAPFKICLRVMLEGKPAGSQSSYRDFIFYPAPVIMNEYFRWP